MHTTDSNEEVPQCYSGSSLLLFIVESMFALLEVKQMMRCGRSVWKLMFG